MSHARQCLVIALVSVAPVAALAQSSGVERYFPLVPGNRWVWTSGAYPLWYYHTAVVGDTTIGGDPYAVVTTERRYAIYQTESAARCALRLAGGPVAYEIEALRVSGTADCLAPQIAFEGGTDLSNRQGTPMTVEIGGETYALDEVLHEVRERVNVGLGFADFAAGVGPLFTWFAYTAGGGGGGEGSKLVYAEVDGATYGTEPLAYPAPDPARFYPLGAGDTWVYGLPFDSNPAEEWEVRTVVGDTTIGGDAYALVARQRLDASDGSTREEARCAVRYVDGWFEWVAVTGACAPVEEAFRDRGWWAPFTEVAYVEAECDVSVNHQRYDVPYCFDLGHQSATGSFTFAHFAADLGFVSYSRFDGMDHDEMGLAYARVGGVAYGANPVAAEGGPDGGSGLAVAAVAPNPFRRATALDLVVPRAEAVRVEVFDGLGRRVRVEDRGVLAAGRHRVVLDGGGLAPGVYVVRVTAGEAVAAVRLARVE